MIGTAACIASRAAWWRDRRETPRCRYRRAASPARAPRVAATVSSSAARTRWPSVWPSGISRTPAEIQLATSACRKAGSAVSQAMPCPAQATPTAIGSATAPFQAASNGASAGHGHAARVASRKARPCAVVSRKRSFDGTNAAASSATARSAASSAAAGRTVRMNEEDGVAKAAAFAEHHREPLPQRLGVLDVAGLDRPFDAAGIGKGADRIGRRQPGHEAIERGGLVRSFPRKRESGRLPVLGPRFRGDERSRGRVTPERRLAMIVVVMVVMTVIMPMRVVMTVAVMMVLVGAVLRIERRFDWRKPRAEPAQHVLDHMIAADAQPVADDLHVDVAVADVPGEPRQLVACRPPRSRSAAPAGRRCARWRRRRARGRRRRAARSLAADRAETSCRARRSERRGGDGAHARRA